MYTLKGKLIGRVAILFNRVTEEAEDAMEKRKGGKKPTREEKIAAAYDKVYPDGNGGLAIPGENLVASLLRGCAMCGLKRGRRGLTAYLEATVFPAKKVFSLGVNEPDGIDRRRGRNPNNKKQMVMIYRPYLKEGWELPFELEVIDDSIPAEQVRESLEYAGVFVGICDYRPRFGRFGVEWEDGDGQGSA